MSIELERIEGEALKLSAEDRERLIEALIESLETQSLETESLEPDGLKPAGLDEIDGAATGEFGGFATLELQKNWLDEAERRMALVRSGQMSTHPAGEVMAEARAMLKAARENR